MPPAPAYVSAAAQDSDGLRVSWRSPWTRQRNKAITGYIVQWKQASHSWSDSAQVSSMEAGPKSISAQVNGLTEGVLYTVRVIATNAVGDGPPSEDAIGRPQPQTPHPVSAAVNGQTLTLRAGRRGQRQERQGSGGGCGVRGGVLAPAGRPDADSRVTLT